MPRLRRKGSRRFALLIQSRLPDLSPVGGLLIINSDGIPGRGEKVSSPTRHPAGKTGILRAATAVSSTVGLSLKEAMDSSVMYLLETAHSSFCSKRTAPTRTIMTSVGPLTYRPVRYRSGASGSSPVPVDESQGLVDDYLTRPSAQLGLLMMGHRTAGEAAAFVAKIGGMTPWVSFADLLRPDQVRSLRRGVIRRRNLTLQNQRISKG